MDRQQIRSELENILTIVDDNLTKGVNITEATLIREGLGLDSLQMTELLFEIEDRLGVKIADEEALKVKTVGDLMDIIQGKKEQPSGAKGPGGEA